MTAQEQSQFDELYRRYSKDVVAYLMRRMGFAREDAEDIAQQTFLGILKNIGRHRENEWAYVRTAAHNEAANRIRNSEAKKRDQRLNVPIEHIEKGRRPLSIEDVLIRREETDEFQRQFAAAMDALSELTRKTFLLRMRRWSYAKIAATLGIPLHSVATRLDVAKKKMLEHVGSLPEGIDFGTVTGEDEHDREE